MRILPFLLLVVLLSLPNYSSGQRNVSGPKVSSSSPGAVIPVGPSRNQNVYNSHGQLQQTVKRDSSGNYKVYDKHGHLQQTIKMDSSGNRNIFNEHGQLQYYVKPDGKIMNQHGHEVGRITLRN